MSSAYSWQDRQQQARILREAPRRLSLAFEAATRAKNKRQAQRYWNEMRRAFFGEI